MNEREVIVRDNNGSIATFGIIAVIVVALLIALFVWRPWTNSDTTNSTTKTTINNPPADNSGNNNGSSQNTTSNQK